MKKLSDINPIEAYFMNERNINNYVFQPERIDIDENGNYDIGIVLGCPGKEILECRLNDAIILYHEKLIDNIMVSGGTLIDKNTSEAELMYDYLLSYGISKENVIIENESKSTYENMLNSLKLLRNDLNSDNSIVVITSDFHSKRAKGILKLLTDAKILSYGSLDGRSDIDKWTTSSSVIKKIIRHEARSISWHVHNHKMEDQLIKDVMVRRR